MVVQIETADQRSAELLPLVILLVIASVISLGYYLRLVWIMFMNEPEPAFETVDGSVSLTVVLATIIGAVVFFIFIGRLSDVAVRAVGL